MAQTRFLRNRKIYDSSGQLYLEKFGLTPMTPWGQLVLHTFHKGDDDRDYHDHPWDFLTMPLGVGYVELQHAFDFQHRNRVLQTRAVKPWMLHFRKAEVPHKVVCGAKFLRNGPPYWDMVSGKFRTLVWTFPKRREWGFHTGTGWVDWKTYVSKRRKSNVITD